MKTFGMFVADNMTNLQLKCAVSSKVISVSNCLGNWKLLLEELHVKIFACKRNFILSRYFPDIFTQPN